MIQARDKNLEISYIREKFELKRNKNDFLKMAMQSMQRKQREEKYFFILRFGFNIIVGLSIIYLMCKFYIVIADDLQKRKNFEIS